MAGTFALREGSYVAQWQPLHPRVYEPLDALGPNGTRQDPTYCILFTYE